MNEKEIKKRIILATGIFPPQIGGPATFAKNLFLGLKDRGEEAIVVTFGEAASEDNDIRRVARTGNKFFDYLKYSAAILSLARKGDVLYGFDLISVGLPCSAVKLLRPGIKLVFRLGGDYQWEMAVQKGSAETLEAYYAKKNFNFREKTVFFLTSFALRMADRIIFNALFLKELYGKYRGVPEKKARVIKNIKPAIVLQERKSFAGGEIRILYAGRMIAVRNLERLIEAFAMMEKEGQAVRLEMVGEGPEKEKLARIVSDKKLKNVSFYDTMEREALYRKINDCQVAALVSTTEVNSNFVSESILSGKGVVLTRNTEFFYTDKDNDQLYFVDPLDVDDIKRGLEKAVGDAKMNKRFQGKLTGCLELEDIIEKHLQIFYE